MNLRLSIIVPLVVLVAPPALAQSAPVARAAAYNDAIVAAMKAKAAKPARVERFRTIVSDYYDMPGIAALVAGPVWTNASAADRQALVAALTRHSAIQLAKNFASYGGEKFVIDPTVQQRGDSAIVKTTITGGGSSNVLYYRVRSGRIVDVISNGVSQLAVQRADVASIAASGGVSALVRRFQEVDGKSG